MSTGHEIALFCSVLEFGPVPTSPTPLCTRTSNIIDHRKPLLRYSKRSSESECGFCGFTHFLYDNPRTTRGHETHKRDAPHQPRQPLHLHHQHAERLVILPPSTATRACFALALLVHRTTPRVTHDSAYIPVRLIPKSMLTCRATPLAPMEEEGTQERYAVRSIVSGACASSDREQRR